MSPGYQQLTFFGLFVALSGLMVLFDQQSDMLRDTSKASPRPYSFARVQLAWWTVIVMSAFIAVLIGRHEILTFLPSTLILLGISAATTGAARIIDQSDLNNPDIARGQDQKGQNLFLDILSDGTGVNIHRFQTVLFNLVFGIWFIATVLNRLGTTPPIDVNGIIPIITDNNLILLGLSSGTYAALKTTENKVPDPGMQDKVSDESGQGGQGLAQG